MKELCNAWGTSVYTEVEKENRSTRYSNAIKPSSKWKMAVHEYRTDDNCGTFYVGKKQSVYACEEHYTKKVYGHYNNCGRLGCPICGMDAASGKAEVIAGKLRLSKYAYSSKNNVGHWSLNTIAEFDNKYDFNMYRRGLVHMLQDYMDFGILITHAFRFEDKDDSANLQLKFSLHFHVMGCGRLPEVTEFMKQFGFNYTFHGYRNSKDDIKSTISYLLNHASYFDNCPCYCTFGMDNITTTQMRKAKRCEHHIGRTNKKGEPAKCGKILKRIDPKCYTIVDGVLVMKKKVEFTNNWASETYYKFALNGWEYNSYSDKVKYNPIPTIASLLTDRGGFTYMREYTDDQGVYEVEAFAPCTKTVYNAEYDQMGNFHFGEIEYGVLMLPEEVAEELKARTKKVIVIENEVCVL